MVPLALFAGFTNLIVSAADSLHVWVTLDASRSYDSDDPTFQYYWLQGNRIISTNAVVRLWLKIGCHRITLRLDDTHPYGVSSSTVTLKVLTPAEAVEILLAMTKHSGLPGPKQRILGNVLEAAAFDFGRGRNRIGLVRLQLFREYVRTWRRPIRPALAKELEEAAQSILGAVLPSSRTH